MIKFVSKCKNPYGMLLDGEKTEDMKGQFIPKSKAKSTYMLKNNTANIQGRKVTFKHV